MGQACHSRETKSQVLRRWQNELSGLQSLLFVERCGEGRKPKNKVPEALHFQETWRASLDAPRVPGDSGCCLEHQAGLTPQTRSLPRHTRTHTHTHTLPQHTHTHTHTHTVPWEAGLRVCMSQAENRRLQGPQNKSAVGSAHLRTVSSCFQTLFCFDLFNKPTRWAEERWFKDEEGASLVVWWLGRHASTAGTQVQSLVRKLRSHMLHRVAQRKKNEGN